MLIHQKDSGQNQDTVLSVCALRFVVATVRIGLKSFEPDAHSCTEEILVLPAGIAAAAKIPAPYDLQITKRQSAEHSNFQLS